MVSFNKFILESFKSTLVIVDIQEQDNQSHILMDDRLYDYIKSFKTVIWFFNGEESGYDENETSMKTWCLNRWVYEYMLDIRHQRNSRFII